jgi:undecaprenyl-diphosphatase
MDFEIARFFNHLGQGTIVDNLSVIISYNGGYFPVLVLLGFLSLFRDKINGKKVFVAMLFALVLHFTISEAFFKDVLPHYVSTRERPYIAHPQEIFLLGKLNVSPSFPSNHMSSIVTVLGVLIFYYRKYWKYAVIFAILMALSRMHNGMHYPSDVIGGTIFGLIYSQLAVYFVNKNFLKINKLIDNGLGILK